MRKLYFFLIAALLMPVLAFAQDNKALSFTQPNPYNNYTNTVEIPYVGLIEDQIPATKDVAYSVGFWIKPGTINYSSQFNCANGKGMGMLFGFGTNEHTNLGQWQYGLGYDTDGRIQLVGSGSMGAATNGFAPDPAVMIDSLSKDQWNYVVFAIDNANLKARLYVNGKCVRDAELSKPGMYWSMADMREGKDNGKWPTFQFFSFIANGQLDEVQFYNTALNDDQVTDAMASAWAVNSLIALYDFNEVKAGSTSLYANQVPGGSEVDARYCKINYGAYWAGSANVNRSGSSEQNPVVVAGRDIEIKDVTINIPETVGGSIVLESENGNLTTGENVVKTQSIYTVNATPAEGYVIKNLYNKINGNAAKIKNGSKYVVVADAEVYGEFSNELNNLTVNVGEGAEYAMTREGIAVEDVANLINGETYDFTVTITDPAMKLVDVKLGEETLEAVNGVYSFVSAPDQVISINTVAKPVYTINFTQPAAGGTIAAVVGEDAIADGETAREGDVVNFVCNAEENWVCVKWYVNGEAIEGNSIVLNENITVSADLIEGIASCIPEPVEGRALGTQTKREDRLVRSVVVTNGDNSITLDGNTAVPREIYMDQSGKMIEATAGSTLTFTTAGIGVWMRTYIWADFDYNGLDKNDLVWGVYDNSQINIAGTRNITIPADLEEGKIYRVRYMVDWVGDGPCVFGQASGDNGEYIADFSLMVKQPRIENARNVTIKANDEALGTVAFTSPKTTDTAISTDYAKVGVVATVAEGATFLNWTNAAGEVISRDLAYVYEGTEDIELTANFGYAVNYAAGEGGNVAVTVDGKAIASGEGVLPNSAVTIEALPNEGFAVEAITINGEVATENPVTVNATEALDIEVTFAELSYTYTATTSGNGSVVLSYDSNEDETAPGEMVIANGSNVTLNESAYFFIIPGEGDQIIDASVTVGDEVLEYPDENYYWEGDGCWVASFEITGNVVAVANFSGEGAIDGIEADDANAPVEFFNLQGIRVNEKNMAPGFYIRRQGSKAVKVYVNK